MRRPLSCEVVLGPVRESNRFVGIDGRFEEELLSVNPLRIRISITLDDEQLRLTFDGRMDMVDMNRCKTNSGK